MSLLIRGWHMPESCRACQFSGLGGVINELSVCMLTGRSQSLLSPNRLSSCPLVEVPEEHGRLIDGDALNDMIDRSYPMTARLDVHNGYAICQEMIKKLPAIIPAERSNDV